MYIVHISRYDDLLQFEKIHFCRIGQMATPDTVLSSYPSLTFAHGSLRPEERGRLETRRAHIQNYEPPKWRSSHADDVSGERTEVPMVDHASILPA